MSSDYEAIKYFFIFFMSLGFAYAVFERTDHEIGLELKEEQARYMPYISGALLPSYLIMLLGISLFVLGAEETFCNALSLYTSLIIHISIFYSILIMLLPTLRKYINARAIAFLWMIPNYLYMMLHSFMNLNEPLLVLNTSNTMLVAVFSIILVGAFGLFGYHLVSHLIYRHKILKDSQKVIDSRVLNIWNEELTRAHMKKVKFQLVESNQINTPLSIGLFKRTTKIMLPHLNYTDDELRMIFRHEIVHIGRDDVWSKFFLMFITSLCWYNPLIWIAKKSCSDDIELSCDETVLIDMDELERQKYAKLILNNAESQQGFTTCLSASASALRYRLKNIIKPKKRTNGAIIVGLAFFVLAITCGFVTISYNQGYGSEYIFNNENPNEYTISNISIYTDPYNRQLECVDVEGFNEYLSNIELASVAGNYLFDVSEKEHYTIIYHSPNGTVGVVVYEEAIKVVPMNQQRVNSTTYYVVDDLDWTQFNKYIKTYPALRLWLKNEEDSYYTYSNTTLLKVFNDDEVIYELKEDNESGRYGSVLPVLGKVDFSCDNILDYSIDVHTWDYSSYYTITKNDLNSDGEFKLADYSAHYHFNATINDPYFGLIEVEYFFNMGDSNTTIPE